MTVLCKYPLKIISFAFERSRNACNILFLHMIFKINDLTFKDQFICSGIYNKFLCTFLGIYQCNRESKLCFEFLPRQHYSRDFTDAHLILWLNDKHVKLLLKSWVLCWMHDKYLKCLEKFHIQPHAIYDLPATFWVLGTLKLIGSRR